MSETGNIFIEKLDLYAYHGCYPEEERLGQHFTLDIALETDIHTSALSDELRDTVDYGKVVAVVTEAFTVSRYKLIEAAGRAVAQAVLKEFPQVSRVWITLRKVSPPIAANLAAVGIRLDYRRDG